MANPNPIQTEDFKAKQYKSIDDPNEPLAKKTIGIKLPISIYEKLEKMTPQEKGAWLRRVISKAAIEELE